MSIRTPPLDNNNSLDDKDVTIAMAQTFVKIKEEKETEPMEKIKKKVQGDAQIERDAKIALRLQAELDEELRVERERQEEASKNDQEEHEKVYNLKNGHVIGELTLKMRTRETVRNCLKEQRQSEKKIHLIITSVEESYDRLISKGTAWGWVTIHSQLKESRVVQGKVSRTSSYMDLIIALGKISRDDI
ncbi:hypothetical protein Tco_0212648 [Tanacetum coccineum]